MNELQRREHGDEPDRHAHHGARFLDIAAGEQIARADRQHDETGGEIAPR